MYTLDKPLGYFYNLFGGLIHGARVWLWAVEHNTVEKRILSETRLRRWHRVWRDPATESLPGGVKLGQDASHQELPKAYLVCIQVP